MADDPNPSTPLQNGRWEAYAQNLAEGMNQTEAYIAADYKARGESATNNAARLLVNASVAARVEHLKQQAAERAVVTAEDILRGLKAEAQYMGEGSSHGARVAAWGHLGRYLIPSLEKTEHSGDIRIRIIRD